MWDALGSWGKSLLTDPNMMKNLGSLAGGIGSIYGGIKTADAMKDMNSFRMNSYNNMVDYEKENDKRRRDAVTNGYGNGSLGSYSTKY